MTDTRDLAALERACALIERAPQSGVALLLYGLLKTMETEQRGSPFALTRLRMIDEETRALVYALMESYARQANRSPRWQALVQRMDEVIAQGAAGPV